MRKLITTVELIDRLKARKGFTSDYQLWKFMGWKQTTVSNYRSGRHGLGRAHAIRVADELGLPREYVIACVELERESDESLRGVWQQIAARFRGKAASILLASLVLGGVGSPTPSEAYPAMHGKSLYIMSNRRRRRPNRALELAAST